MPEFKDILKEIQAAINNFNEGMPQAQKAMYQEISAEMKRLDTDGDRIKATVANLRIINSVKNKLLKLILTDDYMDNVKGFVDSFNTITKLQNQYWSAAETSFKPGPLLAEIKNQAITDTVTQLTESGIGANIGDKITEILRTNITSGGSYKALQAQLLESLTDTQKSDGLLTKYSKQITNDSVNQFNAQYTQAVSNSLGFEWFAYQGTDIMTTRPFCDAMTDFRYFHISEVPRLLRAEDLYYMKKGKSTKVPIYPRTGLPGGMIEGTNPANFFIRRGGYNCGHQIRPVSEKQVPLEIRNRVFATAAYKAWAKQNGIEKTEIKDKIKEIEKKVEAKQPDIDIGLIKKEVDSFDRAIDEVESDMGKTAFMRDKMTIEQKASIELYTRTGYEKVNRRMRQQKTRATGEDRDGTDHYIDLLEHSLDKLDKFKGVVYRGAELDQAVLDEYTLGKTITKKAFTSTSKAYDKIFKGNARFIIHSKSGRSVESISHFEGEQEVLFKPGTKFTIIVRKDTSEGAIIEMVEVD